MGVLIRPALLLTVLVGAAYATALGNGFAYDDNGQILTNPLVQDQAYARVMTTPYWPSAARGSGLFRPLTTTSFILDWQRFGDNPLPYHVWNVLLHLVNTFLVAVLARGYLGGRSALVAAALFAVHPVHSEAVANIVGRGELLACLFVLLALTFVQRAVGRSAPGGEHPPSPEWRIASLCVVPVFFLLALGSKENGVALLPLLFLVGWAGGWANGERNSKEGTGAERGGSRSEGLVSVLPLASLLVALLSVYLLYRWSAIGALGGDAPAPELRGLSTGQRLLTAISLWPEYLRLMVFPLSLSADYGPAVLLPAMGVDAQVILGALLLLGLGIAITRDGLGRGTISFGLVWFTITILPVSQVLFPAGTILAERTLYLPSVGACLTLGALWGRWEKVDGRRRLLATLAAVIVVAFGVRTAVRNPSWDSTYSVFRTLHRDHPESYLAQRARAGGLVEAGEYEAAAEAYQLAVDLSPRNYSTLAEAGEFFGRQRAWERAEALLRRAIEETPDQALAYRLLSAQLVRQGRPEEGRSVASQGLGVTLDDPELWRTLSEGYAATAQFDAAVRARQQVLRLLQGAETDRQRLTELRDAAARAEAGVRSLEPSS